MPVDADRGIVQAAKPANQALTPELAAEGIEDYVTLAATISDPKSGAAGAPSVAEDPQGLAAQGRSELRHHRERKRQDRLREARLRHRERQ